MYGRFCVELVIFVLNSFGVFWILIKFFFEEFHFKAFGKFSFSQKSFGYFRLPKNCNLLQKRREKVTIPNNLLIPTSLIKKFIENSNKIDISIKIDSPWWVLWVRRRGRGRQIGANMCWTSIRAAKTIKWQLLHKNQ